MSGDINRNDDSSLSPPYNSDSFPEFRWRDRSDAALPKKWSDKEDQRLREAIEKYGDTSWRKISEYVKTRDNVQCLQRWQKVLKPGLVKGCWSRDEDEKLKMLVAQGFSNWGKLAVQLPGRTSKQCRERWKHHLDPSVKKESFSDDEDARILQLHEKWGNRWSAIARMLPGRTETIVRSRFKYLQNAGVKLQKLLHVSEPTDESATSTGPDLKCTNAPIENGDSSSSVSSGRSVDNSRATSPVSMASCISSGQTISPAILMCERKNSKQPILFKPLSVISSQNISNEEKLSNSQSIVTDISLKSESGNNNTSSLKLLLDALSNESSDDFANHNNYGNDMHEHLNSNANNICRGYGFAGNNCLLTENPYSNLQAMLLLNHINNNLDLSQAYSYNINPYSLLPNNNLYPIWPQDKQNLDYLNLLYALYCKK